MPSLLPEFEYDIFISYRHNDNRSGWVTEFVNNLKAELASTIKDSISVYYDANPHDGLLETHHVDKSLEGKLKCLIFIPIISHTYCDLKCFAWNNEFVPFCKQARIDSVGLEIQLANRNVASRILPIQIHDIDSKDRLNFEQEVGSPLRPIEFIFRSPGVNRPLAPSDSRLDNVTKTFYRDQINKVANAIDQLIQSVSQHSESHESVDPIPVEESSTEIVSFWNELIRRNVWRAGLTYGIVSLVLHQFLLFITPFVKLETRFVTLLSWVLLIGLPVAMLLAWFYELSPNGFVRTNSSRANSNPFPPGRKKPFTDKSAISILLVILISQYLYLNVIKENGIISTLDEDGNKIISIAVLPFENRGGDQYIADGITDDIINRLIIIKQFRVTNKKRSKEFAGNLVPLEEIAKDLKVTVMLTGSVERLGNKVAIRAHLIDQDNTYIWGNTFERSTQDIIAVQSEIAQMIADELKVKLSDTEKEQLHKKATNSATAYDLYMRGMNQYYLYKPSANDSAIHLFKMAIKLDPQYARAWAGLGDSFAQKHGRYVAEYFWTDSSIVAASKSIQLDSNLSMGYKALANAYDYRDEYEKSLPLLQKSVALDPTNSQAIGNLGTNYLLRGDLPMALRWYKKGIGMDPKNWIPYQLIGWTYRLLGDLENAELWLLKSLELNPNQYDTYELLAYTYVTQGKPEAALKLIPEVLRIGENDTRVLETAGLMEHFAEDIKMAKSYFQRSIDNNESYKEDHYTVSPIGLGQILLQEGNRVEAEVYLNHALEYSLYEIRNKSKSFDFAFNIASIYAINGNREKSLEWLKQAIAMNWIDYAKFTHGPHFYRYKNDPEFLNLIDQVKSKANAMLADYKEN